MKRIFVALLLAAAFLAGITSCRGGPMLLRRGDANANQEPEAPAENQPVSSGAR